MNEQLYEVNAGYNKQNYLGSCYYYVLATDATQAASYFNSKVSWLKVFSAEPVSTETETYKKVMARPDRYLI